MRCVHAGCDAQLKDLMVHDRNGALSRHLTASDLLRAAAEGTASHELPASLAKVARAVLFMGDDDNSGAISLSEFEVAQWGLVVCVVPR